MEKEMIKNAVLVLAILLLLLIVKEAKAFDEMYYSYYNEEIPYVFARGKPYPELSHYRCINNKLAKEKAGIIYMYDGNAVSCEIKLMTRKEYEEYNSI